MKKYLIIAAMALLSVGQASAQYSDSSDELAVQKEDLSSINKRIWGKGRFLRIGYSFAQTCTQFDPVEKSKYSFFLTKGTTYRFPKKALGGLVKIGIDAVWFDIQFSKFKAPYSGMNWSSDIIEDIDPDDSGSDESDFDIDLNIGRMAFSAGMGVGPNVSVAPFALTSIKGLQPLRASIYFHYAPTAQIYAKSQDGDMELSAAFCHMMNFGGNISYRAIAIGVEGRWGKSKFKPLDFESMFGDEDEGLGTQKYTRKFANTRLYIQFSF